MTFGKSQRVGFGSNLHFERLRPWIAIRRSRGSHEIHFVKVFRRAGLVSNVDFAHLEFRNHGRVGMASVDRLGPNPHRVVRLIGLDRHHAALIGKMHVGKVVKSVDAVRSFDSDVGCTAKGERDCIGTNLGNNGVLAIVLAIRVAIKVRSPVGDALNAASRRNVDPRSRLQCSA